MHSKPFIILSEVDSTQNYAMAKLHAGLMQAGSCFQAVEQTAGKGQRGRSWNVKKGENITMSLCLRPAHTAFPFLLSAAMALGCYDFIKESGAKNIKIKWPNDVYVNDRKAAGILIENIFRNKSWEWAVVGVGLNVNQVDFGELQHKATSLKLELHQEADVTAKARELHRFLLSRYEWMKSLPAEGIMREYNSLLYRKDSSVKVKRGPAVFETKIREVNVSGELVTEDALERKFAVGEIELLL